MKSAEGRWWKDRAREGKGWKKVGAGERGIETVSA